MMMNFLKYKSDAGRIALLLVLCLSLPAMATELPSPFVATYDVHHAGARVGSATITLAIADDNMFDMSSITIPRGVASFFRSRPIEEFSRFNWNDQGQLIGHQYNFKDGTRKGKRNSQINFDWDTQTVSSNYKKNSVDLDLVQALGDRLSLQALLMKDLQNDSLQPAYSIVDRNAIKTYQFKVIGAELVDTPAGRFDTVKILKQREGSSRSSHIWASRDHGFATVKLIQFKNGKAQTDLVIRSITLTRTPQPEFPPEQDEDAVVTEPAEPETSEAIEAD